MNDRLLKLQAELNNTYKKPIIMVGSDVPKIFRVPIDNPAVNWCCTGGGVPVNRIIELYGEESSGKTFNACKIGAAFQKVEWRTRLINGIKVLSYKEKIMKLKDDASVTWKVYLPDKIQSMVRAPRMKLVVLIDVEGTYDPYFGAMIGLDNKLLVHVIPDTAEQAVNIADAYLRDPDVCCVIFDSVAVARAAAEIDKPMEDQTMGMQARFWNRAAAKFQAAMNNNPEQDVTLVLINRAYSKIGLVFGDPEVVGSGSGLKYAKSISLKFRPLKILKEKIDGVETIIGRTIEVENKKNKTGRPFRDAQYFFNMNEDVDRELTYGQVDRVGCIFELGLTNGLIVRSGNSYTYQRHKINGRENFEEHLRKSASLVAAIEQRLYEIY